MRKNQCIKFVLAISFVLVALFSVFLTSCASSSKPEDEPEGSYSFENPAEARAETDSFITMDGNFEEDFWAQQRWLTYEYEITDGYDITTSITSYFGEKGYYFAIRVDDQAVNYNENKLITQNSGIELMFAEGSVVDGTNNAYRYSFAAGGMTKLSKLYSSGYADYFDAMENTPWSKTVLLGGTIESGNCTGYTTEVFIPSGIFGLSAAPSSINVNLGFIASTTSGVTNSRYWVGITMEHIGASWTACQTWYKFNSEGLISNNVIIGETLNGNISTDYDYILSNMSMDVSITPDSGYRIKSVTVDGQNISDSLVSIGNGVCTYTITGSGIDVTINAEFEAFSQTMGTVTGNIYFNEADFTSSPDLSDLYDRIDRIVLTTPGYEFAGAVDFDTDITFTVTANEGSYKLTVFANEGHALYTASININGTQTVDISIGYNNWNNINYLSGKKSVSITENTVYFTTYYGLLTTHVFTFGARLETEYNKGTIVPEVRFSFDNGNTLRLQIFNWAGTYTVKTTVTDYENDSQNLASEFVDVLKDNGGYVIVTVDGTTLKVYLYNGSSFQQVYTRDILWLSDAYLQKVEGRKADDTLDRAFKVEDTVILTNITDASAFLADLPIEVSADFSNTTGIVGDEPDFDGSYTYGEGVNFQIVLSEDYLIKVTHNGTALTATEAVVSGGIQYSYTFDIFAYNELVIKTYAPALLEAVIDKVDIDEATIEGVYAIDEDGSSYKLTEGSGGLYSKVLFWGEYQIKVVSTDGYAFIFEEKIDLTAGDAQGSYTLSSEDWITDGYIENIENITTSEVGVYKTLYQTTDAVDIEANSFTIMAYLDLAISSRDYVVPELKFDFDNGKYIRVQLIKWGTGYWLNINNNGTTTSKDLSADVISAVSNGTFIVMEFSGNTVTAYIPDTGNVYLSINSVTTDWLSGTTVKSVTVRKTDDNKDSSGNVTLDSLTMTVRDTLIGLNKTAAQVIARYYEDTEFTVNVNAESAEHLVGNVSGIETGYSYGGTVQFSLVADSTALVVVKINGEVVTTETTAVQEGTQYSYSFTIYKNTTLEIVTAKLSLSITLNKEEGLSDVESVTAIDSLGTNYQLNEDTAGNYVSIVAPETYSIRVVSVDGYSYTFNEKVSVIDTDVTEIYDLTESNWITDGYIENIADASTTQTGSAFDTVLWQANGNISIANKKRLNIENKIKGKNMSSKVSLDWEIGFSDDKKTLPKQYYKATVPGAVQTDMAKALNLPDINIGTNYTEYIWTENKFWHYRAKTEQYKFAA